MFGPNIPVNIGKWQQNVFKTLWELAMNDNLVVKSLISL